MLSIVEFQGWKTILSLLGKVSFQGLCMLDFRVVVGVVVVVVGKDLNCGSHTQRQR